MKSQKPISWFIAVSALVSPLVLGLRNRRANLRTVAVCLFVLVILSAECGEESPVEKTKEDMLGDYFPVKLANRWKYDYFYSVVIGGEYTITEGSKVWEVVDGLAIADSALYTVREIFSGRRTSKTRYSYPPDQFRYDTTNVGADTSYIFFSEDKNHSIKTVDTNPSRYRSYLNISVVRFNPLSIGDTLRMEIPGYISTIQFVANVGMVLYDWFRAGNHSYREWYRLTEYDLH